jgi:hypothetical protein
MGETVGFPGQPESMAPLAEREPVLQGLRRPVIRPVLERPGAPQAQLLRDLREELGRSVVEEVAVVAQSVLKLAARVAMADLDIVL